MELRNVLKTLVILPTYNERDNIRIVVDQILALELGVHVLIVDDDSPDGTGALADELSQQHPDVSVMHRMTDRGRGRAGKAGFRYALDKGYDYIIEMDADLSHHPAQIPDLLAAAQDCDVVIGSRHVGAGRESGRGLVRRLITHFASRYMRFMLGVANVHDCTSGFRCFRREALEAIDVDTLESVGPPIVTEVLSRCRGLRIEEIPIQFTDRVHGESKFGFRAIRDSLWIALKIRLKRTPRAGR